MAKALAGGGGESLPRVNGTNGAGAALPFTAPIVGDARGAPVVVNVQQVTIQAINVGAPVSAPARAPAPSPPPAGTDDGAAAVEKLVAPRVDTHYENRKGYQEKFLGVTVPLPKATKPALLAKLEDGGHVIPYEHFSIVVNKKRRLALFTASNVDGSKKAKLPGPGDFTRKGLTGLGKGDLEKWVTDPRIPEQHQLPDVFYTKDRQSFDKGHIVRREDVCWGTSYGMVVRANGDSFHTTNCSPQVSGFNQSGKDGVWGELENFILKQAANEKYCLYAGPVFQDDDEVFEGLDDRGAVSVQIPQRFWKVVVAVKDGQLQSFAFVLEQDLSNVSFRPDEFAVNATWKHKMVSLAALEGMLDGVELPKAVKDADQFQA